MEAAEEDERNVVEREIAKGEQDDVLEKRPERSKGEMKKSKPRSRVLAAKTAKRDGPQVTAGFASARIEELARPTKQRVLITLRERATTLPAMFVDNLIRIVEAASCLTPEEAARIVQRRKRKARKVATRFPPPPPPPPPPRAEKREIARETTYESALDRDATMCQYLLAERLVRSILEYNCVADREDIREIAEVILKRLTLHGEHTDAQNGDRATRQSRLLADVVACWIADVLVEVAKTREDALKKYCEKRRMKMLEVDEDVRTEDEYADSEQIVFIKERDDEEKENEKTTEDEEARETEGTKVGEEAEETI